MVRLTDMSPEEAEHLRSKACDPFDTQPWVTGPPLAERRVAIMTSAGLHRAGEPPFGAIDLSYRVIHGSTPAHELTMTHSSIHFDRTGFRADANVVFPIDRLHELAREGVIGSVADFHYSLMGAGWPPQAIEPTMRELAARLRDDAVDAVCLAPV
jgi:D-proline reductase (dithiol) PrdB